MNAYIAGIVVFNSEGEKRIVALKSGLNIITGDSKSGKSALLEIIDYCLGSSKSTIPKGIITNFSSYYAIVMRFKDYDLCLGRKHFEENGRRYMYFYKKKEKIKLNELTIQNIFDDKYLLSLEHAKNEMAKSFGMLISDITEDSMAKQKSPTPSVRNMTSYMFQHQNLITNKFTLFYRFEDSTKREQTINQFPVFAGWVNQKYYNYKVQLDELLRTQKREERHSQMMQQMKEDKRKRLIKTFQRYYSLIGEKLSSDTSFSDLQKLRKELPDFTRDSYLSLELESRLNFLRTQREELRQKRYDVASKISTLELTRQNGASYSSNLKTLQSTLYHSTNDKEHFDCPLCGNAVEELNERANSLIDSKRWLKEEIQSVGIYDDKFYIQMHKLKKEKNKAGKLIKDMNVEIERIEGIAARLKNTGRLENEIIYAKYAIDQETEAIEFEMKNTKIGKTDLEIKIEGIEAAINDYNLGTYYSNASSFFKSNISRIVEQLDFEQEFRPAAIDFQLKTFDLFHFDKKNNSKVYLSEMGSGANWLACHLGLFLTFLHFFSVEEKACIPSILFLDQPSQVYFPDKPYTKGEEKPHDIAKVEQVFKTILDEISLITSECGYEPQVIITDHVGELSLEGYNFEDYVRKNWRGEHNKFI